MHSRLQRHDGAGRSAVRKHKELRAAWEQRMFRRIRRWVWLIVYLVLAIGVLLPGMWRVAGVALAVAMGVAWAAIREMAAPDHIQRWERVAWGEQWTAKELRPLKKQGWILRHDIANGAGNRDHIVVGGAVFLLDTKNLEDDLTLENGVLRVRRIDQPRDSYLLDKLNGWMLRSARSLSREIRRETGEGVWVYPVVVLWGRFDEAGGRGATGSTTFTDRESTTG